MGQKDRAPSGPPRAYLAWPFSLGHEHVRGGSTRQKKVRQLQSPAASASRWTHPWRRSTDWHDSGLPSDWTETGRRSSPLLTAINARSSPRVWSAAWWGWPPMTPAG